MSLSTPDSSTPIVISPMDVLSRLQSEPPKAQLPLIQELLSQGEAGLEVLMNFLLARREQPATLVEGSAYQALAATDSDKAQEFLQTYFPDGILVLSAVDSPRYAPLQRLLGRQEFEAADKLTVQLLCQLAGQAAIDRKWLYFTDLERVAIADLHLIDRLWRLHSADKFGFSVQRELWLSVGKNWDNLWPLIGWKAGNNWTRYPQEFVWNLSAPKGHLPLSNQLRGVRVIAALLNHPAWTVKG